MTAVEASYDDLISEAFIKPIRSVLIVDDDYPTVHEVLMEQADRDKKFSHKDWNKSAADRAKVRKVIEEFRRSDSPFLLDIHDGLSPSEETDHQRIGTLHQTDLLILDYQLDKAKAGDGAAAIEIAREALENRHFNLVLVHTQENLDRVFYEFLIKFLKPSYSVGEFEDPCAELQEFLNQWEDQLLVAVQDAQYASARLIERKGVSALRSLVQQGIGSWSQVRSVLEQGKLRKAIWMPAVNYALVVFEQNNIDRFAKEDLGVSYWSEGGTKFIRAARGFIAFKSKDDEGELLPAIKKALIAWDPRPPRLILTKLRAEMNERGIEVQDDALGHPEIGAVWYEKLLRADDRNVDQIVDQTVRNHAEQLLDKLLPGVNEFAMRIREIDRSRDVFEAVQARFGMDLRKPEILISAKAGHNAFVGSKPVRSSHLELGHILKISEQYWLCLTPACDMVPKRHRGRPFDRLEGVKRFAALKLEPREPKVALTDANRGGQIFANVAQGAGLATERMCFASAAKVGSSPAWMTMYVGDDGYLPKADIPECQVSYVAVKKGGEGADTLELISVTGFVCGMLRYEYALEIQSKLVASQARIGLDFLSHGDESDADDDKLGMAGATDV